MLFLQYPTVCFGHKIVGGETFPDPVPYAECVQLLQQVVFIVAVPPPPTSIFFFDRFFKLSFIIIIIIIYYLLLLLFFILPLRVGWGFLTPYLPQFNDRILEAPSLACRILLMFPSIATNSVPWWTLRTILVVAPCSSLPFSVFSIRATIPVFPRRWLAGSMQEANSCQA